MPQEHAPQEQPTVAVLVPTVLLAQVWDARRAKAPRCSRSQVVDAALAFLCTLVASGVVPAGLTLPDPGRQPMTEVYVRPGYLLNACDLLGTHDPAVVAHTALVHARNSLQEHGHTKPVIHRI